MEDRWTIEELGRQVQEALATDYEGPRNGQVSALPNPRTIRYYTTLGLLDRPAEMRGRTALYSRRHLLQLVAIKRLQAGGASLAQVQQKLAALGDADLAALARLPAAEPPARPSRPAPRREDFWRAAPAANPSPAGPRPRSEVRGPLAGLTPPPLAGEAGWGRTVASPPSPEDRGEGVTLSPSSPSPQPLTALALAPGVTLLLSSPAPVSPEDGRELLRAAAPLLAKLESRGLLAPGE